jgi:hypothetical protein
MSPTNGSASVQGAIPLYQRNGRSGEKARKADKILWELMKLFLKFVNSEDNRFLCLL